MKTRSNRTLFLIIALYGASCMTGAHASGLRLPVSLTQEAVAHKMPVRKKQTLAVVPVHNSVPCTRKISESVWMNVLRSEAMLTAITCGRRDAYNAIMSVRGSRKRFASAPVRVLIRGNSHDYTAELANQQSLYDNQTYGEGICHIRETLFTDMQTISPRDAMAYVLSKDIAFGNVCSNEEIALLKKKYS